MSDRQDSKTGSPASYPERLLLAAILLAALLPLYHLDRTSLWSDEASSLVEARLPFWDMIDATARDNYPPLHNIILFAAIRLFGDSETILRLPSALFGFANVLLLYRLGGVLWDRRTGLIAAALLAISGFATWYSQEARMYALLAMTSTAYVLTVVLLLERPTAWRVAFSVIAGSAMLYSHPYGTFLWAGINVVVPLTAWFKTDWPGADWRKAGWRYWLLSQGLTGLVFLPWFLVLGHRLHQLTYGFWIVYPAPERLLRIFGWLAGGPLAPIGFSALTLLAVFRLDRAGPAGRRAILDVGGRELLLLAWLLAPVLIGYLISITAVPILMDRYLICSLPAAMLLSARGIQRLAFNRVVFAGALAAAIVWSLPGFLDFLFVRERPDFRGAAAAVLRDYRSGDAVILYRRYITAAFLYYAPALQPDVTGLIVPDPKVIDATDGKRLWIVDVGDSHGDGSEILDAVGPAHVKGEEYDFALIRVFLFLPNSS